MPVARLRYHTTSFTMCCSVMGMTDGDVVPLPGDDDIATEPSCAATIAATIDRPRPDPPERAGSGRVGAMEAIEGSRRVARVHPGTVVGRR